MAPVRRPIVWWNLVHHLKQSINWSILLVMLRYKYMWNSPTKFPMLTFITFIYNLLCCNFFHSKNNISLWFALSIFYLRQTMSWKLLFQCSASFSMMLRLGYTNSQAIRTAKSQITPAVQVRCSNAVSGVSSDAYYFWGLPGIEPVNLYTRVTRH